MSNIWILTLPVSPSTSTKKFKLIELVNDTYRVKLMYVDPLSFSTNVFIQEGQKIGVAQDISSYWGGGMTNHLHVEVYKNGRLTDPEPLFDLD